MMIVKVTCEVLQVLDVNYGYLADADEGMTYSLGKVEKSCNLRTLNVKQTTGNQGIVVIANTDTAPLINIKLNTNNLISDEWLPYSAWDPKYKSDGAFHNYGTCGDDWAPLSLENTGSCHLDYIRFEKHSDSNVYELVFQDGKKDKWRHACWHKGDEIYLDSWTDKADRFILVRGASHRGRFLVTVNNY